MDDDDSTETLDEVFNVHTLPATSNTIATDINDAATLDSWLKLFKPLNKYIRTGILNMIKTNKKLMNNYLSNGFIILILSILMIHSKL